MRDSKLMSSPKSIAPSADAERFKKFFSAIREQASTSAECLTSFFGHFERDYHAARHIRAKTTPHLDVLRVFGLEFAELRHSDVLAWFLRPMNDHEQGSVFLNALLRYLGLKPVVHEHYTVLRERHERTDVAVYAPHEFAIFIENKVRHFERAEQLSDMIASLTRVSQERSVPRERRFAIFLTDTGADSTTGPKADSAEFLVGNLKPMSRVDLFEIFREALRTQPPSPLLMCFLDSYTNSIRRIRAQLF